MAGGRPDVADGLPQPQRPVGHGQHRLGHALLAQVTEQVRPGLRGFPVAIGHRDQFFGPVGTHPDQDQQAQGVLIAVGVGQADVDVHPVGPHVHVVDVGQRSG